LCVSQKKTINTYLKKVIGMCKWELGLKSQTFKGKYEPKREFPGELKRGEGVQSKKTF